MGRLWTSTNSDGAIRGTLPPEGFDASSSRQHIRAMMTRSCFNQFSRFNLSRRIRRSMARDAMHLQYAATRQGLTTLKQAEALRGGQ